MALRRFEKVFNASGFVVSAAGGESERLTFSAFKKKKNGQMVECCVLGPEPRREQPCLSRYCVTQGVECFECKRPVRVAASEFQKAEMDEGDVEGLLCGLGRKNSNKKKKEERERAAWDEGSGSGCLVIWTLLSRSRRPKCGQKLWPTSAA
ncbi:hypothetical protein K432DRAFT_88747 [Lepidopterella palustris CBS 459.81]|uniref:Uncharacterized protein n=1 Tax=Lepidopterella palustris CBS 459.81 TaxID=1314670 RepID=A0A8E2E766_9PEZI|nr:hypothetical protein K432DRAFT_88747 [Lepidopterella palustris CBS 459.81]